MNRKPLVTLALSLLPFPAGAVRVLEPIERAVELTLDRLVLPTREGGAITLRECATCAGSTHRLLGGTVLQADGQVLPLGEFLRIAAAIAAEPERAERAIAVVFLDVATLRVTRIELRE